MHTRTWLSFAFLAGVCAGSAGILRAAESGNLRVSSMDKTGDINAVNSQIVIGGGSAVETNPALVVGNGRLVTRAVPVAASFHGIDLSGVFEAEVTCGTAAAVELLIDENLQPLIAATVRNGILSLRFTKPVQTKESPRLKIALPVLDILQLSGGDTVRVADLKGAHFKLIHEGTGAVKLAGKVKEFVCTVSGVGEVDAGKLACRSADISISGVGGVTCRPEAKLKVTLSGIGGVRCLTQPATVEKNATGLGNVEFIGK